MIIMLTARKFWHLYTMAIDPKIAADHRVLLGMTTCTEITEGEIICFNLHNGLFVPYWVALRIFHHTSAELCNSKPKYHRKLMATWKFTDTYTVKIPSNIFRTRLIIRYIHPMFIDRQAGTNSGDPDWRCRTRWLITIYRIYHMYSDRQAWASSLDPDETPQNAASHLGLHCLPLIQQFLDRTSGSELYWFKF